MEREYAPFHLSIHVRHLISEKEDGVHRGKHGVSGATNQIHVVVAALIRYLSVFILGDIIERPNEDVIWMGRAKRRGFFPTPVPLEELPGSYLLPIPVGISLTDQRRVLRVHREPPRPSPLLKTEGIWFQSLILCVSTPNQGDCFTSWAHAPVKVARAATGGT